MDVKYIWIGMTTLFLSACVFDPIGIPISGNNNDASVDSQVDVYIASDVIIPDGCVAQDEVCDYQDNNCNGLIDESFDLENDQYNCGGCGVVCEHQNAASSCVNGDCTIRDCFHNYWDLNGDPTDGCEYFCVQSNNGQEICDNLDNDCDGTIDEGYNLQSDILNCGACDNECSYSNATAGCNSSCYMQGCQLGWWNLNGNDSDGCEYQCAVTNSGNEICDNLDNDCDGIVDEGYNLLDDENNCGSCGNICSQNHTTSFCVSGVCEVQDCETDITGNIHLYWDVNNDPSDGCEYFCQVSVGAHEICDSVDNNCDGVVDEFCNSLVLYLPFGDSFTLWPSLIYDRSGTGNSGQGYGGTFRRCGSGFAVSGEGVDNCCAEFIGTGYIEIQDDSSLEGFTQATWMLWVKPDNNTPIKMSLSKVGSYRFTSRTSGDYQFEYAGGSDAWYSSLESTIDIGIGIWRLLTVVYTGSQLRFYVDGVLMNQKNANGAIWGSSQHLYIGANSPGTSLFSGNIDEVAIYTRAWSEAEIQRYFQLFF